MKKYAGYAVLLLIGIVAGIAIGSCGGRRCHQTEQPVAPVEVATPALLLPSDLQQQEATSSEAYLLYQRELESGIAYNTGSAEPAQKALEQLLEDYSRQPPDQPGEEAQYLATAKALTHARLARIALAQGDPMEYERHLAMALELSGEPSEESLFQKVDSLDQAKKEKRKAP